MTCSCERDVRWWCHFQRCMAGTGASVFRWDPLSKCPRTTPPLDSCGLVWAGATGGLREGKFPLNWLSATVLGCNDFTNGSNSAHILKMCFKSHCDYFLYLIALESILTDVSFPYSPYPFCSDIAPCWTWMSCTILNMDDVSLYNFSADGLIVFWRSSAIFDWIRH